jgi:hypothetical protein
MVLLLRKPRQSDADQVREVLLPVLGEELAVSPLPARRPNDATTSLVLTAPDGVYDLTFGSDRFAGDDDSYQPEIPDEARKEAVAGHAGWLAITASGSNRLDEEAEFARLCRLTAALLDDDSLAIYVRGEGRLLVVDPETGEALRSDDPWRKLPQPDDAVWLFRVETADDDGQHQSVSPRRRFKDLAKAFAGRGPGRELQVQVELCCGFAHEPHWLRVEQVLRGTGFDDRLIARFTTPSLLMPHYRRGEPLSVAYHQILDWKCSDAETSDGED